MADPMPDAVVIEELVLRIPGVDRRRAQEIAAEVVRRLADALPRWRPRSIPSIHVRLALPPDAAGTDLAAAIAGQILGSLA